MESRPCLSIQNYERHKGCRQGQIFKVSSYEGTRGHTHYSCQETASIKSSGKYYVVLVSESLTCGIHYQKV